MSEKQLLAKVKHKFSPSSWTKFLSGSKPEESKIPTFKKRVLNVYFFFKSTDLYG
jgi:hypothetical protein